MHTKSARSANRSTVRFPPTRDELHDALHASGVKLDLDLALANPNLAHCLTLAAEAARSRRAPASMHDGNITALNQRLRRLVGEIDHQLLRAGDRDD
jgi:hypothetical protein